MAASLGLACTVTTREGATRFPSRSCREQAQVVPRQHAGASKEWLPCGSLHSCGTPVQRTPLCQRPTRGRPAQAVSAGAAEQAQVQGQPLVKICGLTRPEDAALAAQCGASFAGMILWRKAGRYVDPDMGRAIARAAREGGAEPVGVFVDADAEEMEDVCRDLGISTAQLHGDVARAALDSLPPWLSTVYVAHVDPSGVIVTPLPGQTGGPTRVPDWVLLDGLQGGSGVTIDWERLRVPEGCYKQGWILAGGLTPANVGAAIAALSPRVVDVSSGVCGPDKLAKDQDKIRAFVHNAIGGTLQAATSNT